MRLLLTFLLLLLIAAGCETTPSGDSRYVTLKIITRTIFTPIYSLTDKVRGGFAYLASVLKIVRDQEKSALILDAGDMYKKGGMPTQLTHDQVTADLVSMMPYYDARAVGNNEVKVGVGQLLDWAKTKEKAPLLSANFVDNQNKTVFSPPSF